MKRRLAALAALTFVSGLLGPTPSAANAEGLVAPSPRPTPGVVSAPPPALVPTPPPGWPQPPPVTAEAYVLAVADSGQVLAERAADEPRLVASTVKLLTALTVLARADLDEEVMVGDEVADVGGASTGVEPGEMWTVEELLAALLVRSGNDAAVALAVHVGGSVPGFLELMRADAAALGLGEVVLESPSGLEDRNQLSARQLTVIARAALDEPRVQRIAAQPAATLPGLGTQENRNVLIGTYPGATGLKTGFTQAAQYAVVASAARDGRELLAVVLASEGHFERFEDAETLLDHGFATFVARPLDPTLVLARGGEDARLAAAAVDVAVPVSGPRLQLRVPVPIDVPGRARSAVVRWNGSELFRLDTEVVAPPRPEVTGGAALGRALHDRVGAAMRAAIADDAWER